MLRKKIYKILSGICLSAFVNSFVSFNVSANDDIKYNSIEEFIDKTYEEFLLRNTDNDDGGSEYWSYLIRNHEKSLYDYMISLLSGEEFLSREISNEDFLIMLYEFLLNRIPTEDEKNYWIGKLLEENEKLGDIQKARIEISKSIFNEPFFREISDNLGVTFDFENLNTFGIEELRTEYSSDKISYIDSLYKSFDELEEDLYSGLTQINNDEILDYLINSLPIFNEDNDYSYEELKNVSNDNVRRLVYGLDYEVVFPYDQEKVVYISPFLQMNKGDNLNFVTLGLGITSRGIGKTISKAEIILGDELIDLNIIYNDDSKYDSKQISVNEVEFVVDSSEDLKLLDKILSSDLSKIRLTFDDSQVYMYSLYEKDRVRNTLRFMSNLYLQIMTSYLVEIKNVFDTAISDGLR